MCLWRSYIGALWWLGSEWDKGPAPAQSSVLEQFQIYGSTVEAMLVKPQHSCMVLVDCAVWWLLNLLFTVSLACLLSAGVKWANASMLFWIRTATCIVGWERTVFYQENVGQWLNFALACYSWIHFECPRFMEKWAKQDVPIVYCKSN